MPRKFKLTQCCVIAIALLVAPIASTRPAAAQYQIAIGEAIVSGVTAALTEYAIKHLIDGAQADTREPAASVASAGRESFVPATPAAVDRPVSKLPSNWEVVRSAYKSVGDQDTGYVPPGYHVVHQDNVPSNWEVIRSAYQSIGN
jgi:hypothetical protein